MKPNYKRLEQFGFTFEEYDKEYQRRYPDYQGPSSSSDCGKENDRDTCGCWVCCFMKWNSGKRSWSSLSRSKG